MNSCCAVDNCLLTPTTALPSLHHGIRALLLRRLRSPVPAGVPAVSMASRVSDVPAKTHRMCGEVAMRMSASELRGGMASVRLLSRVQVDAGNALRWHVCTVRIVGLLATLLHLNSTYIHTKHRKVFPVLKQSKKT